MKRIKLMIDKIRFYISRVVRRFGGIKFKIKVIILDLKISSAQRNYDWRKIERLSIEWCKLHKVL